MTQAPVEDEERGLIGLGTWHRRVGSLWCPNGILLTYGGGNGQITDGGQEDGHECSLGDGHCGVLQKKGRGEQKWSRRLVLPILGEKTQEKARVLLHAFS